MKTNHKICTINKDNVIQKQMHFSMDDFCTFWCKQFPSMLIYHEIEKIKFQNTESSNKHTNARQK